MALKIAIVGTGHVARENYLPFLARQEDVELLYHSRTRAKAEACAAQFGGRVAAGPAELAAEDPDAILVLTREEQRFDAASALLEHGVRRLFFEKPLVAGQGQAHVREEDFFRARELLGRARAVGAETAMVFNYRFFEQTKRARRILEERDLGRPTQVTALVHYACWSHCIDLVHLFAGRTAEMSATAGQGSYPWSAREARDVAGSFRCESGAVGTILGTCALSFRSPLFEMTFCFERGRLRFQDLDGPMELVDYRTGCSESYGLFSDRSRWDHYRASFEKAVGAYLDSIRGERAPPVPGLAGLVELQFEAALRRSAAEGRRVDVPREFPLDL